MPRILKRPMFRSGGSTNEGIMHGLVDRKGYEHGSEAEKYRDEYKKIFSKITPPKPKFNMGQMGFNLASGEYAGDGLIQNIVKSARDPYTTFTKADDARGNIDYQIEMLATKMGISRAEAEQLAKIKSQKKSTFAAQTPEAQVAALSKQLADINSGNPAFIRKNSNTIANQIIQFQMAHPDIRFNFKQPTFVDQGGKKGFDPNTIPVGTYFYDVITNTFKLKKADEIVVIDPNTLQEVE
jgi:hypothetical protein